LHALCVQEKEYCTGQQIHDVLYAAEKGKSMCRVLLLSALTAKTRARTHQKLIPPVHPAVAKALSR